MSAVYHYKGRAIFGDLVGFTVYLDGTSFNMDSLAEAVDFIDSQA